MSGAAPGPAFGRYELLAKLGEGGMGEVWKARDSGLHRLVAIKFLKDTVNETARQRFLHEAQAASALNHPRIVTIYELGTEAGRDFIAMEFVPGATLDRVIAKKPLPVSDAVSYAIDVADALAAAHRAGIVHRDLKPSNIVVGEDGRAKVLDFGLAKLAPVDGEGERTATMAALTQEGVILGTFAYMSPEQAQGKAVDGRSDIFSFGAVLYEMLAGRRAFGGETTISTLAAIINQDPPALSQVRDELPAELERIVRRCLRKDPARRFQTMGDLKVALEDFRDESQNSAVAARPRVPRWKRLWPLAAATLAGAAAVSAAFLLLYSRPSSTPLVRITAVTQESGLATEPAISPDGKLIAYSSDRSGEGALNLWVQQAAGGEPIRVTRGTANDIEPHFSPDGSRIVFRSDRDGGGVYMVAALGGEPRLVARRGYVPRFSPDGKWISLRLEGEGGSTGRRTVAVVPADGGAPIPVSTPVNGIQEVVWSPDSSGLLFSGAIRDVQDRQWCLVPLNGEARCAPVTRYAPLGASPASPTDWAGEYVYFDASLGSGSDVWRVRIDNRLAPKGPAERLTTGGMLLQRASVASAPGSSFVFASNSDNSDVWSIPLERGAVAGDPVRVTSGPAAESSPSVSGDAARIAYTRGGAAGPEVRLRDASTGVDTRLDAGYYPMLSRDATRVAYDRGRVLMTMSLSDRVPEKLSDEFLRAEAWSSDGRYLLLFPFDGEALEILEIQSRRKSLLLERKGWKLHSLRLSPDERWVTFHASPTAATRRVYIAPFRPETMVPPDGWLAVTDGTHLDREPRWSADGRAIVFLSDRDGFRCIWAQKVAPEKHAIEGQAYPVFHAHTARLTLNLGADTGSNGLSIAPDRIIVAMKERAGNVWIGRIEEK